MFSSNDQVKTNQRNLNFRLDNTHRGSQRDIKSPDFAVKTQKSPCVHSILLILEINEQNKDVLNLLSAWQPREVIE